ncbi:uncharacterized protein IL334_003107 [Kwoniella shivajii]|uniref:Uncharacterized protein n=1 Tax=Kwoniella shivajii TaxID=564305 RepID=A0ABZ1CYD7_9TREE|nr:hypothetical protein IL334_003107 [Kwoniella shivajii]
MTVPFLSTVYWLVQNIQYVIAIVFGIATIACSVASWYILRWLIPSPRAYIPFLRSNPKTVAGRRTSGSKTKDVKLSINDKRVTRASTAKRRQKSKSAISGLGALVSSTLGSVLFLCSIASGLICAYSLTEKGCYTLRHIGILEWLPWKQGLKCYKTRWDWVADILGEVMLNILQGHDFGGLGIKSM